MASRSISKKPVRDPLKGDKQTLEQIRQQLPNKFLLAAAQFLQRALLQVDRAGPYHAALMSGIFHDHHLKAIGKTPPGVQILINIPGMQPVSLEGGQAQQSQPDAPKAIEE